MNKLTWTKRRLFLIFWKSVTWKMCRHRGDCSVLRNSEMIKEYIFTHFFCSHVGCGLETVQAFGVLGMNNYGLGLHCF